MSRQIDAPEQETMLKIEHAEEQISLFEKAIRSLIESYDPPYTREKLEKHIKKAKAN